MPVINCVRHCRVSVGLTAQNVFTANLAKYRQKSHTRNMSKRGVVFFLSLLAAVVLVAGGLFVALNRHDITRSLERAALPEEVNYQDIAAAPSPALPSSAPAQTAPKTSTVPPVAAPANGGISGLASATSLPAEINLAIPFTSQAPHGRWENPFKEFCEEASILMATRYLQHKTIAGPDEAAQAMLDIQAFEQKEFGYCEDTTAEEVATILRKHFGITNVQVVPNPTVDDIKRAVAAGKPVIVPAAGRLLGNPFYTPPGPLYHMLVIKGYTASNQFITHDPGTRRGADFLYAPAVLMNAIHDWRSDGHIEQGRKVIVIVG